jgi:succinylglutamate desuccinylase
MAGRGDPLLVVVAGLHGNERSGVEAARRLLAALEGAPLAAGRVVALLGNVQALHRGVRYQRRDLNRLWTEQRVREIASAPVEGLVEPEEHEMRELLDALLALRRSSDGRPVLLDLHTSSADGPPFFALGSDPLVEELVDRTGVVEVRGITTYLEGMLVERAAGFGYAAFAFEAGRHEDPASVLNHEAVLWHTLASLAMIGEEELPAGVRTRREEMGRPADVPPAVRIVHRHRVHPGDRFAMRPGYRNFQPVREGEVLARDGRGPIRAPLAGRIFLPLYQPAGEEGFFLTRDVAPDEVQEGAGGRSRTA